MTSFPIDVHVWLPCHKWGALCGNKGAYLPVFEGGGQRGNTVAAQRAREMTVSSCTSRSSCYKKVVRVHSRLCLTYAWHFTPPPGTVVPIHCRYSREH